MAENRDVGCLCCKSGPLSITLYTDRGGYCPGESIGVSAVINNNSNNEVLGLEFQLIEVIVYIASCGKLKHINSIKLCDVEDSTDSKQYILLAFYRFFWCS